MRWSDRCRDSQAVVWRAPMAHPGCHANIATITNITNIMAIAYEIFMPGLYFSQKN